MPSLFISPIVVVVAVAVVVGWMGGDEARGENSGVVHFLLYYPPTTSFSSSFSFFAANTYIRTNRRTNERTNGRRAEMRSSSSSSHLPSLLFYVKSSNPLSLVSSKEGRTAQQPRVGGRWLVAPPRQVLNFALLNWLPCSRSVSISRGRLRSQCRRQSPLFPTNRSYIGRSLAKGRSRQGKERTGLAQLVRQNAPPIKEIRRSS